MSEGSWHTLRQKVHSRAGGICEYCWTDENNTGLEMHVDHIDPQGKTELANLALSCQRCNLAKAAAKVAVDPDTGHQVELYNPRIDTWQEHFEWVEDFSVIVGKSARGRASISRLRMNDPRTVIARRRWRNGGTHPPTELIDSEGKRG